MGITGAGKSYLIKKISGQDVTVGHSLQSCTQHIQEVRCQIGGESVTILDMPGFDDTTRSDTEVLTEVADHLALLYVTNFQVCGIIYLHSILEDHMRGSSYKNLQMFGKLCGSRSYSNVVMLTGRWDSAEEAKVIKKENELKADFWKMYLDNGCHLDRYRDRNDLVRIFDRIVQNPPVVLEIQHEMVDLQKSLDRTAAGEHVNQELMKKKEMFEKQLAEIATSYNQETNQIKAVMDAEQLKLQNELEKLKADKLMLKDSHRRAEEASRAGMMEQFRQLEQERKVDRAQFLELLKSIKDEHKQLDVIYKYLQDEKNFRKKERGFMSKVGKTIAKTTAKILPQIFF